MWWAVTYNGIIGPYLLEVNLNRNSYLDMLQHFLSEELEELPLLYTNSMYFQHDGCPAHYSRIVCDWLTNEFGQKWIGRNGPILWPPLSPDLTILDFYLWGRLKQIVYSEPLDHDEEQLKQRIRDAIRSLSVEEIRRSYDELRFRVEMCADLGGALFE